MGRHVNTAHAITFRLARRRLWRRERARDVREAQPARVVPSGGRGELRERRVLDLVADLELVVDRCVMHVTTVMTASSWSDEVLTRVPRSLYYCGDCYR
jgi:hypothetical protein